MNTFPDSSGKREIAWSRLSTGFHPSTHGFTRDTVSIPVYARVYRYFLDSSQVDDPLITNRALPTISYRPIRRHLAIDALMRSPVPKASCSSSSSKFTVYRSVSLPISIEWTFHDYLSSWNEWNLSIDARSKRNDIIIELISFSFPM